MEQFSDDELDHAAEEDSDKEDQDLDKMFGAWLGELDKLTKSLDDGRPEKVKKAPLRQESNMANMAYRFSVYNINEALNQGDAVDLDALMADLCSIEQELSTITQLEKASQSMDEAARQSSTSFSSAISAPYSSSTMRRPTSHHHHHRTGSVGTVTEHEVRSFVHSSRSSINSASASSMDSLDIEKPKSDTDGLQDGQDQPSSEVALQGLLWGSVSGAHLVVLADIQGCRGHLYSKKAHVPKV
ncbi:hypothetical protein cypCar_00015921 [Cyprinus carpio]|nr:hypothetical protein cypCar_00015921 [Cyprinus carpio]